MWPMKAWSMSNWLHGIFKQNWIQNMLRRLQAILIARLSQSFQTWHRAVLAKDQKDIAKELLVSYDFQAAHQDFPSIEL